jgi:hypothetical protein
MVRHCARAGKVELSGEVITPVAPRLRFVIDDAPVASPHRPAVRAGVERVFNGYRATVAAGVVTVMAWPHRPIAHARAIARRVLGDAAGYLAIINLLHVPGVDVRAGEAVRHV